MRLRQASPLAKQMRANRERARRQRDARHEQNEKVLASLRKQQGGAA